MVFEAMLCRPVIATDVAGPSEVIEDGVTGFLASSPRPQRGKSKELAPGREAGFRRNPPASSHATLRECL